MKLNIDHIVISVKDLKKSINFYKSFLGKPTVSKSDAYWKVGGTKLFLTFPYKKSPKKFDKHDLGLNHIAFGVKSLTELHKYERVLKKAKITNSGIKIDKFSNKEFIWFNDP